MRVLLHYVVVVAPFRAVAAARWRWRAVASDVGRSPFKPMPKGTESSGSDTSRLVWTGCDTRAVAVLHTHQHNTRP